MNFTPQSLPNGADEALMQELARWRHTPYRPNHQMPGVGADCIRFVVGVYDRLYGITTAVENLPPDTALTNPEKARSVLRAMARRYGAKKVTDGTMEPGDAVIFAFPGAGPTHVAIAGSFPWYYHADMKHGVQAVGIDGGQLKYHAHYRLPNKSTWAAQ